MSTDVTKDKFDHRFKALYDSELDWQSGLANELLTLPEGVQVKVLNQDLEMKRIDMKVKFPPGYVEPAHSHKSWHSIVVLKGRMCVAGKDLRPGDYVFGWDEIHGPYEYPDAVPDFRHRGKPQRAENQRLGGGEGVWWQDPGPVGEGRHDRCQHDSSPFTDARLTGNHQETPRTGSHRPGF